MSQDTKHGTRTKSFPWNWGRIPIRFVQIKDVRFAENNTNRRSLFKTDYHSSLSSIVINPKKLLQVSLMYSVNF